MATKCQSIVNSNDEAIWEAAKADAAFTVINKKRKKKKRADKKSKKNEEEDRPLINDTTPEQILNPPHSLMVSSWVKRTQTHRRIGICEANEDDRQMVYYSLKYYHKMENIRSYFLHVDTQNKETVSKSKSF